MSIYSESAMQQYAQKEQAAINADNATDLLALIHKYFTFEDDSYSFFVSDAMIACHKANAQKCFSALCSLILSNKMFVCITRIAQLNEADCLVAIINHNNAEKTNLVQVLIEHCNTTWFRWLFQNKIFPLDAFLVLYKEGVIGVQANCYIYAYLNLFLEKQLFPGSKHVQIIKSCYNFCKQSNTIPKFQVDRVAQVATEC